MAVIRYRNYIVSKKNISEIIQKAREYELSVFIPELLSLLDKDIPIT
jgi:hypothetical protein